METVENNLAIVNDVTNAVCCFVLLAGGTDKTNEAF